MEYLHSSPRQALRRTLCRYKQENNRIYRPLRPTQKRYISHSNGPSCPNLQFLENLQCPCLFHGPSHQRQESRRRITSSGPSFETGGSRGGWEGFFFGGVGRSSLAAFLWSWPHPVLCRKLRKNAFAGWWIS